MSSDHEAPDGPADAPPQDAVEGPSATTTGGWGDSSTGRRRRRKGGKRRGHGGSKAAFNAAKLASKLNKLSCAAWATLMDGLVLRERAEEVAETTRLLSAAEASAAAGHGVSVVGLVVETMNSALFGRTLVKLGPRSGAPMPAHKITTGDIVGLRAARSGKSKGKGGHKHGSGSGAGDGAGAGAGAGASARSSLHVATGIVSRVSDTRISVVLDEQCDDSEVDAVGTLMGSGVGTWGSEFTVGSMCVCVCVCVRGCACACVTQLASVRLDRLANDATYTRLRDVLQLLKSANTGTASSLCHLYVIALGRERCAVACPAAVYTHASSWSAGCSRTRRLISSPYLLSPHGSTKA